MGIDKGALIQLANEGINEVEDLADVDKETLQQVTENLKRLGKMIPNLDPSAASGSTTPQTPFPFGSKFQKRLLSSAEF
eukprot:9261554-Ditylum_brightwellii.AAC.1